MNGYFFSYRQGFLQFFLAFVLFLVSVADVRAQCPTSDITVNTTDVTCANFNDGTLELIVNNPNGYAGDYFFAIVGLPTSGGSLINLTQTETGPSTLFTGLPPGTYTWFISFSPGCPGFTGAGITITQPEPLTASVDLITPACSPGTGAIDISVTGGNGGYIYAWSGPTNPGNVEDPTNLDAGDYAVTVTDAEGCNFTINNIFVPVVTQADAGPDQVVCENTATLAGNAYNTAGEIGSWSLVSGSGTVADPTDPTSAVSNLGVGDNVFQWFITDANGICAGTADQVVISFYNLELTPSGDILLACNGIADGSGTFTASGGSAPYAFSVDVNSAGATTTPTATSLDFTDAGPGELTVTVTDADGCSRTQTINITEPPAIAIDAEAFTDVSCDGATDGSVTVTASGGTGTLTYTLLPGGISNTTGTFSGLAPGDYTVEVTDDNLCGPVTSSVITVGSPLPITIDNTVTTDVTCNGGADGQIEITASGGTGALTYTLQPAAVSNTTGVFSGLTAGSYTVEITDENGCGPVVSAAIDINEPVGVVIDAVTATDVTCSGASDGSITVTASGGVTPYTFTLLPDNVSNATGVFNGLAAGSYTVEITEGNGCGPVTTAPITVADANPIVVDVPVTTDSSCPGADDGTLTVTASGGSGTLTYTLQPLAISNTTGVFGPLAPGDYTVDVSDENGCTVTSALATVGEAASISIDDVAVNDVSCPSGNDGQIAVTASGGTGTLTFTLQPGAVTNTTGVFGGLTAGTYSVEVTDDNNCGPVTAADIVVTEPALDITVDDVTICNPADGDIVLTLQNPVNGTTFELQPLGGGSLTPPVQQSGPAGPIDLVISQANAPTVTTSYQVAVRLPSCPEVILTDLFVVTVVNTPDAGLAVSDADICSSDNTDVSFVISGSENGVNYELQLTDGTSLTPPVTAAGNGGDLTLTLPAAQVPGTTTTFQVAASTAAGCNTVLTDQPVLTVTPSEAISVAITADQLPVCESDPATFRAVVTNGGANPSYQWQVNGVDVPGETTDVFTSTLLNDGDVIRVVVTGDPAVPCITGSPATSDEITFSSTTALTASVTITADQNPACTGSAITFTAVPVDAGASPSYQWQVNGADVPGETAGTFAAAGLNDGDVVRVILTPDPALSCVTNATATSNEITATFVSDLTATVAITADQNPVCAGTDATFSTVVTDAGANPTYQWQVNGTDVPGATGDTFTSNSLADGDAVRVIVTADPLATCVTNSPVTSNEIIISVQPSSTMAVTISADQNPVCQGDLVTFTASVTDGGANPGYQWQVNGTDVPGENAATFATSALNNLDVVTVEVTADPALTCVINSPLTSNGILMDITDTLTPTVSIAADQNPACTGATINFTSVVADAGPNPSYQWQVNGADVAGETGPAFSASGLSDGDQVQLVVTADPSITCVTASVVTSNVIDLSLVNSLTPQVTVAADQDPSCVGDAVTFTASFTQAGASPSFQWQVNGTDVPGETSDVFSSTSLNDGDVVTVVLTADPLATCVTSTTAVSAPFTVNRVNSLSPVVFANASQTTICVGTDVLFTASVTDAGPNPGYQWQVNGVDVPGETAATFTTNALNDGDLVRVIVNVDPSVSCASVSTVTSPEIPITVTTDLTPSVSIVADQTAACTGTDITFTATPADAGLNPGYQWQVNGSDVAGETGPVFTSNSLSDGDQVQVILTADPTLTCANPGTVASNIISVSIVTSLNPAVTIAADQNPVCVGDAVTWTATAVEAGAVPTYQWFVNGTAVTGETGVSFTSSTLNDGDLISVEVTVDPAATCAVTSVVSSTQEVQNIVNSLTPAVTVTASQTTICPGSQVIFTALATGAGPAPAWQWQINGAPVAGANSDTFTTNAIADGDQVNVVLTVDPAVSCATAGQVTSNTVDMTVRPAGDPACTGGGENCAAFVVTVTPVRPPCTAPDSGELSFEITGGSGNYSIVLSDNDGFSQGETGIAGTPIVFDNLTSADYQYTITDGNGTTCTLPYTLDNETIIEAAITATTDVSCFNAPEGTVTIEILSGGNAPYEYSLDGVLWRQVTTSVFTVDGLSPAESPVGILIRDDASDQCPEEVMVDINNLYPEITASITTSPVLTCDGDEGEITVVFPPAGGNSPNGVWEIAIAEGMNPPGSFDPFASDRTYTGLVAGEYTILIRDEGGCIRELPASVAAPNQVQVLADVNPADCSANGQSGELNLQVTNSTQVPGPYDLVINGLTGTFAGEQIYTDAVWDGSFLQLDTLVSGIYEILVTPSDPDLCALTLEREIIGGPQPVFFDYALRCAPGTSNKELLLTNIQGNDGELYTLQVYDNLTSALVEEVNFSINIGNQFLISNYLFLTQTREYRLRLLQSPAVCAGADVRYDHPDNLVIPDQLLAQIGETTQSLPDRPTGTLEVINFTGGYQPDDNAFPYLTFIEMDSAAIPGQAFSAGFDTVRLNQNFDFAILYEDIPAGRYRVLIADQIGCTRELVARVPLDTDIFIPNIFTPNGDGSNETFFIRNKPDANVRVVVTNRWGKQVYSSDNYQNNWDGDDQPDGVYYYLIDTGETTYKGWVEILRGARP